LWSLTVVTDEPIRPETIAHLKESLSAIEYIHVDKPPQPIKPQAVRPSRRPRRSTTNPPRPNQRPWRNRQRRR
jgi:hypothetical protein